jgi:uncharacterized damage-inducible protein DinB
MVDIRDLLKYNERIREMYFDRFTQLSWEEFTKNREASFHSIRNIFIHTLNAVDFWLSFLQKKDFRAQKKFDEYQSFAEVKAFMGK